MPAPRARIWLVDTPTTAEQIRSGGTVDVSLRKAPIPRVLVGNLEAIPDPRLSLSALDIDMYPDPATSRKRLLRDTGSRRGERIDALLIAATNQRRYAVMVKSGSKGNKFAHSNIVRVDLREGDGEVTVQFPWPATVTGRVLAPGGQAVPDAHVWIRDANLDRGLTDPHRYSYWKWRPRLLTDAQGRFTYASLMPGSYELQVRSNQFTSQGLISIDLREQQSLEVNVPTVPVGTFELTLTNARGDRGAYSVRLRPSEGKQLPNWATHPRSVNGRLTLQGLAPGSYRLIASVGVPPIQMVQAVEVFAGQVTHAAMDARGTPAYLCTGRVIAKGAYAETLSVIVYANGHYFTDISVDRDGRSLTPPLQPGTVRFSVLAADVGGPVIEATFPVAAGRTVVPDIVLATGSIHGLLSRTPRGSWEGTSPSPRSLWIIPRPSPYDSPSS